MMLTVKVPSSREHVISLLRAHLSEGQAFPSSIMKWLAEAITLASERESDAHHAELLKSAAHAMHGLATRQRERDDAHYAHVLPNAAEEG